MLHDKIKGVWDDVRDSLGDSTVGMLLGAALAPMTAGTSLAWAGSLGTAANMAIGGAIGGGYSGGLPGAIQGGLTGYGIGSLASPMIPTQYGGTAAATAPSTAAGVPRNIGPPRGIASTLSTPTMASAVPNPMQSGFSAPNIGPMGTSGFSAPNPVGSTGPSVPNPVSRTQMQAVPDAGAGAENVPWFKEDWFKYASGVPYLLGMFEKPNYQTVEAPERRPTVVDRYYADVAKYGVENVPVPAELAPPPSDRVPTWGMR